MKYFKKRKKEVFIYELICLFMSVVIAGNSILISKIVSNSKLGNYSKFLPILVGVIIYLILQSLGFYLQNYFSNKYTYILLNDLKKDIMFSVLSSPKINIENTYKNTLKTAVTNQLEIVENSYFRNIFWGLYLFNQCIIAIIVALIINPVFVVIILVLSLPPIIIPVIFKKVIQKNREIIIQMQENSNLINLDVIEGSKDVKLNNSQNNFYNTILNKQENLLSSQIKATKTNSIIDMISRFFSNLFFMSVWVIGAYFIIQGKMKLDEVIAFTQLSGSISVPLNLFLDIVIEYINGKKTFDYLNKFIDFTNEEKKSPLVIENIEFKNVTFEKNNKKILDSINLKLDPENKYMIIGESGTGKSTIMEMIFDKYIEYQGQVLINKTDRKKINDSSIYGAIGYFPQKGYIFNGTIRENISMFNSNVSDQEILKLIKLVKLEDWFVNKSLDYVLNNDSSLSGGEKQKILLCRVLLNRKQFIVLDEITSGLDKNTTLEIENILLELDRGFVLISHNYTDDNFSKFEVININTIWKYKCI